MSLCSNQGDYENSRSEFDDYQEYNVDSSAHSLIDFQTHINDFLNLLFQKVNEKIDDKHYQELNIKYSSNFCFDIINQNQINLKCDILKSSKFIESDKQIPAIPIDNWMGSKYLNQKINQSPGLLKKRSSITEQSQCQETVQEFEPQNITSELDSTKNQIKQAYKIKEDEERQDKALFYNSETFQDQDDYDSFRLHKEKVKDHLQKIQEQKNLQDAQNMLRKSNLNNLDDRNYTFDYNGQVMQVSTPQLNDLPPLFQSIKHSVRAPVEKQFFQGQLSKVGSLQQNKKTSRYQGPSANPQKWILPLKEPKFYQNTFQCYKNFTLECGVTVTTDNMTMTSKVQRNQDKITKSQYADFLRQEDGQHFLQNQIFQQTEKSQGVQIQEEFNNQVVQQGQSISQVQKNFGKIKKEKYDVKNLIIQESIQQEQKRLRYLKEAETARNESKQTLNPVDQFNYENFILKIQKARKTKQNNLTSKSTQQPIAKFRMHQSKIRDKSQIHIKKM